LTRYWATEFGGAGVRVNGVASGPVRTPGTAPLLAAHADAMDQVTARGRIGDPEEIAEVVLFLVEERSSYVNGTWWPSTVASGFCCPADQVGGAATSRPVRSRRPERRCGVGSVVVRPSRRR
jgi:NAD(P)-dependent dehydrogenase (short-subunit alcohol dehydrogenase family)